MRWLIAVAIAIAGCDEVFDLEPIEALPPGGTITAAGNFSCGLDAGALYCWGVNDAGQLGIGTNVDVAIPTRVDLAGVIAVTGGGRHACARTSDGAAYCWGDNPLGAIGDGSIGAQRLVPTRVSGIDEVTDIVAGSHFTCALRRDASVWCWGYNGNGQLGTGNPEPAISAPEQIAGLDKVVALAASPTHACARLRDGTVRCWGANESFQLGNGTSTSSPVPVAVTGATRATALAIASRYSCVAGAMPLCWGATPLQQDTLVDLPTVERIATGEFDACAVTTARSIVCVGGNFEGQLGVGDRDRRMSPVEITGLNATEVSLRNQHACARDVAGDIWCWGNNDNGQLGDGTMTRALSPVRVQL